VTHAASVWRSQARAGGLRGSYNLVALTTAQSGGTACARIIVDVLGGGTVNVLATDYP
jgi:hypothetical protein